VFCTVPALSWTNFTAKADYSFGANNFSGTGTIKGAFLSLTPYTPSSGATVTIDARIRDHWITMPAGNITIAVSNAANGLKFSIYLTQDGGGSRTVTWFSTIKWAGGSAPTLTTTGGKRDAVGFSVLVQTHLTVISWGKIYDRTSS